MRKSTNAKDRGVDSQRSHLRKGIAHIFFTFIAIIAVAFMGGSYVLTHYCDFLQIDGKSMENTLQTGDVVTCRKNAEIAQGDIIAFKRNDALVVRRVIAVAGASISITQDGKVYVDDKLIDEQYLPRDGTDRGDVTYPLVIPDGKVFVAGDNRTVSVDSRNSSVGMVSLSEIRGIVEMRVWPVYRIGQL